MRSPLAALLAALPLVAHAEDCSPAPFGDTPLYLRGTMNNWTASDDHEFEYRCDAYYLNFKGARQEEFKVGDAAWKDASTFGTPPAQPGGMAPDSPFALGTGSSAGNIAFAFHGEHTLRLSFEGGQPQLRIGPKRFASASGQPVTDPVAASLHHDTRSLADKRPFGAVPAGSRIDFSVGARPGVDALTMVIEKRRLEGNQELLEYTELQRVPLRRRGGRWHASFEFRQPAVYGYWFEASIGGRRYVLQNNGDSVPWTREKGSNGVGVVALEPAARHRIRRFRQTVYAADFKTPEWAKDAVYYYIFPERFRNGDKGNDPKPGRDTYQDHGVELHANWLDRPWKPGSGDGSDAVYNNDFFGGDLAGIVDKLDYIRDLGANTIYMTPVFEAASNHGYDTSDYRHVAPRFGSDADFTRLCEEAARRGMRVLPDTSLNHVGSDSVYFDRYGKHGGEGAFFNGRPNPGSPYAGWFSFDPSQKNVDKQYAGWVGVSDLPELDKASPAFRRFAYGADDSVTRLWLQRGAAGWRMDVAPWVPDDFWREWRKVVKATRPDAVTVAEGWFESAKFFLGDEFDSTMNYIFRSAVLDYAGGGDARVSARHLEVMRELYPPQAFHALMNLLSSHDVARSLHVLGFADGERDAAKIALAKRRFRLALFFQLTYPGAPAVYYGDEVGMTGGDDPYNRGPYPWADLGGRPDLQLHAHVKQLLALRRAHPVLGRGELLAPLYVDEHVLVLARRLGKAWAITAVNNDGKPARVTFAIPPSAPRGYREAYTGLSVRADASSRLTTTVPALGGVALLSN